MKTFYTAGKIWHAPKFQMLRDKLFYPVKARWIDLEQDDDLVQNRKDILWEMCFEDVTQSDFFVLYSEDQTEEQRGALVEIGMAMASNKPIYAIGSCNSIKPNAISDVAFTHFRNWTWLDTDNLWEGVFHAFKFEINRG
jgi:nucleoside 2-deoxyribosyltransferase